MNLKIAAVALLIVSSGVIGFTILNSPPRNPQGEPGFGTVDAGNHLQIATAVEENGQLTAIVEDTGEVSFKTSWITVSYSGESYSCGNGSINPGENTSCATDIQFPEEGESKSLKLLYRESQIDEYTCSPENSAAC